MLFKKFLAVIIIFSVIVPGCKKAVPEVAGTVKNITLAGCGLMIILDNGERLEIVSKPANVTLIADKKVAITYKVVSTVSICMAGTSVKIISLRYL